MDCPYSDLLKAFGPPNIDWCERALCSYVQEPANTYSNLVYVLVGLWILRTAGKRAFRLLGGVAIFLGIASLIYHASNTYATQVLDFVGMFAYLGLLWVWNLRRAGLLHTLVASTLAYFGLIYANLALMVIFPLLGWPIQMIVMANTLGLFAFEAIMWHTQEKTKGAYPHYMVAVALLLAAAVASALDLKRVWCQPDNHFLQGHATWHVLSGLSFWFVYRFYALVGTDSRK